MGHYEDSFFEIYDEVTQKGLKEQFDKQIKKMLNQDKHKSKTTKEMWEYAVDRIKGVPSS